MSESELRQAYSVTVLFYRMLTTFNLPENDVDISDIEHFIQDLFEKVWITPRTAGIASGNDSFTDEPTLDHEVVEQLVRALYTGHEVPEALARQWQELWERLSNWNLWRDIAGQVLLDNEEDKSWYLTDWLSQRDPI